MPIRKTLLIAFFAMIMAGCSYFSVNTSHCDDIMRNDPNMQNIPQECRDYKEEDADKSTYPEGHTPIEVNKDFEIGK
ncbi:MAG: hypothetical protein WBG65_05490 [Sulfurimonadaceae bacterium]